MRRALLLPFKAAWVLFVVSIPLLGFWLASSLAVYFNGPLWLAVGAGLLFFAVLPLAWHARVKPPRRRLLLRVLAVNTALIAGLLAFYPQGSFEALSTRGDWMIENRRGAIYDSGREALFFAADRLEWLYLAARDAPPEPQPQPEPELEASLPKPRPEPEPEPEPATPTATVAAAAKPRDLWPMSKRLHPLVASLPPSEEQSWRSVAKYLAEHEKDPYLRIKAIHDYLADRIAYDLTSTAQDPDSVFTNRRAVCDGYSQLFKAMVEEIGGQAEYIGGESRNIDGSVSAIAHAWNAVVIEGRWYLVDVTWDAGFLKGDRFEKQYSTDYLLTPPELFVVTHFPSHERWQQLEQPISRGEFLRKPMLRPSFYAEGLELVSPDRSQVTIHGDSFEIVLENPGLFYLIGTVRSKAAAEEQRCEVAYQKRGAKIRCALPASGEYVVRMYGSRIAYGTYPMIGSFDVNAKS